MKELIEKAINIALLAHKGQKDKDNTPYILHPLRVMLQMRTEEEMIVAVLHDVVEDSKFSLEDLSKEGFSPKIINAIEALTRRSDELYNNYLIRIKSNQLAARTKGADLRDNSRIERIKNPTQKDFERIEKYKSALVFLGGEIDTTYPI